MTKKIISHVCEIISNVSFSGGKIPSTKEGQVVQDADRLDAMGAIGIARAFAYGGYKKREIYNPKTKDDTISHFYEKLLLLKNKMNTESAKIIAKEKHKVMEDFLKKFHGELSGNN